MKKTLALLLAALLMAALAACGGGTQPGGNAAPQETESVPAESPAREEDAPQLPAREEDAEAPDQVDAEAEPAEGTEAREPDPDGDGESIEVTATAGDLQPLEPAVEAEAPIASASNLQLTAPEGSDLERVLQGGTLRVGVAPGTLQNGVWASADGSVAASFAASLGLRLIPTEGEPDELAALLEQGELDCLWGGSGDAAERADALRVDGAVRTVGFGAGSALRPLFEDFLTAAREQGALETIGEYYGVTVEAAG